jgi:putative sugar O-methyltransferase
MDIDKPFKGSLKKYNSLHKSKHWEKYNNRKNLFISSNLKNFRNNKLSEGLDDNYIVAFQQYLLKKIINDIGNKFLLKNLNKKNIGNKKNTIKYKNLDIDGTQLFFIKWLYEIKKYISSKHKIQTTLEIGAGFGGLAEKIIRNIKCKYIIIDLPEANFLSSYYLKKNFPKLKFLLSNQLGNKKYLEYKHLNKYDIIIIDPWTNIDPKIKFDLIINTRSMMEMNKEIIYYYFQLIHKHISENGYFFNINRYVKDSVGYPIKLIDYPYDKNWKIVISKKSWCQKWIHQIITRRNSGSDSNIKKELNRLYLETLKYIFLLKIERFTNRIKNKLKKIFTLD